jgi:putative transposase
MCRAFGVSRSGYYGWLNRPPSKRSVENQLLRQEIRSVYEQSKKRLGSPKITVELRDKGFFVSRPRVARIMKQMGIRSIISKPFKVSTTGSRHDYRISKNLLARDFTATQKSQKWVSDITYVRTGEGWLYLSIIMDLYDRKIIGWSMSDQLDAESTVISAFTMAIGNRPLNSSNLMFHSDRGVQYACHGFRKCLSQHAIVQSMSRKGDCWDNAVAENFFKIIKSELIDHRHYSTKKQARLDIFEFIEVWYNKKRKHSYLDYLTPEQFGEINQQLAA